MVIIHFFRNWLFSQSVNCKYLHSGTKSSGWLRYCLRRITKYKSEYKLCAEKPTTKFPGSNAVDFFQGNSWVSRDVIISLGVKSMHSHRREIVFHCTCWPCVWQQICAISWDFFTPVQHNHQYICGWPPLRLTAKYPSETQEYKYIQHFTNFARLCFPYFTTFRNRLSLQFY